MGAFEDFVTAELPQRPTMLTLANTSYSGDPNDVAAPPKVDGAPVGSFFLNDVDDKLWQKLESAEGTWAQIGTTGSGSGGTITLQDAYDAGQSIVTGENTLSVDFTYTNAANVNHVGAIYGGGTYTIPGGGSFVGESIWPDANVQVFTKFNGPSFNATAPLVSGPIDDIVNVYVGEPTYDANIEARLTNWWGWGTGPSGPIKPVWSMLVDGQTLMRVTTGTETTAPALLLYPKNIGLEGGTERSPALAFSSGSGETMYMSTAPATWSWWDRQLGIWGTDDACKFRAYDDGTVSAPRLEIDYGEFLYFDGYMGVPPGDPNYGGYADWWTGIGAVGTYGNSNFRVAIDVDRNEAFSVDKWGRLAMSAGGTAPTDNKPALELSEYEYAAPHNNLISSVYIPTWSRVYLGGAFTLDHHYDIDIKSASSIRATTPGGVINFLSTANIETNASFSHTNLTVHNQSIGLSITPYQIGNRSNTGLLLRSKTAPTGTGNLGAQRAPGILFANRGKSVGGPTEHHWWLGGADQENSPILLATDFSDLRHRDLGLYYRNTVDGTWSEYVKFFNDSDVGLAGGLGVSSFAGGGGRVYFDAEPGGWVKAIWTDSVDYDDPLWYSSGTHYMSCDYQVVAPANNEYPGIEFTDNGMGTLLPGGVQNFPIWRWMAVDTQGGHTFQATSPGITVDDFYCFHLYADPPATDANVTVSDWWAAGFHGGPVDIQSEETASGVVTGLRLMSYPAASVGTPVQRNPAIEFVSRSGGAADNKTSWYLAGEDHAWGYGSGDGMAFYGNDGSTLLGRWDCAFGQAAAVYLTCDTGAGIAFDGDVASGNDAGWESGVYCVSFPRNLSTTAVNSSTQFWETRTFEATNQPLSIYAVATEFSGLPGAGTGVTLSGSMGVGFASGLISYDLGQHSKWNFAASKGSVKAKTLVMCKVDSGAVSNAGIFFGADPDTGWSTTWAPGSLRANRQIGYSTDTGVDTLDVVTNSLRIAATSTPNTYSFAGPLLLIDGDTRRQLLDDTTDQNVVVGIGFGTGAATAKIIANDYEFTGDPGEAVYAQTLLVQNIPQTYNATVTGDNFWVGRFVGEGSSTDQQTGILSLYRGVPLGKSATYPTGVDTGYSTGIRLEGAAYGDSPGLPAWADYVMSPAIEFVTKWGTSGSNSNTFSIASAPRYSDSHSGISFWNQDGEHCGGLLGTGTLSIAWLELGPDPDGGIGGGIAWDGRNAEGPGMAAWEAYTEYYTLSHGNENYRGLMEEWSFRWEFWGQPLTQTDNVPRPTWDFSSNSYPSRVFAGGAGTIPTHSSFRINTEAWDATVSGFTITDAYTFYIQGPPAEQDASITFTNAWAAGFGGQVDVSLTTGQEVDANGRAVHGIRLMSDTAATSDATEQRSPALSMVARNWNGAAERFTRWDMVTSRGDDTLGEPEALLLQHTRDVVDWDTAGVPLRTQVAFTPQNGIESALLAIPSWGATQGTDCFVEWGDGLYLNGGWGEDWTKVIYTEDNAADVPLILGAGRFLFADGYVGSAYGVADNVHRPAFDVDMPQINYAGGVTTTLAEHNTFRIQSQTLHATASGLTVTNAYGLKVDAPTDGGANITLANTWAAGFGGNVDVTGYLRPDALLLKERADHLFTPAATFGELWLKNDTAQKLMFTSDTGVDFDLTNRGHGEIYVYGYTGTQTTNATPGNFDVVTAFNTASGFNGSSYLATNAKASNKITLNKTGKWFVSFSCSFGGTGNSTFNLLVYVNGVAQNNVRFSRKLGAGGDVGRAACNGIITATAGQDLDVRVASDGTSDTFSVKSCNLNATFMGVA